MQEHHNPSSVAPSPTASSTRSLWLAVGALSIAVAGLGGTLLGTQLSSRHVEPAPSGLTGHLLPFDGTPTQASAAPEVPATVKPAPVVRAPAPAPVLSPRVTQAVQSVPVAQHAPVCASCGTVLSVAAVQRAGPASGVGAVAGGVVGGLLGNQIGGGSGRAVATVVGAVGGGWAGHETEKRVRQTTRYAVRVRMDDGSVRTVEQDQAIAVGTPVQVQAGVARPMAVRG